jgi:formylglycine-generating enzyme required for sulfatase activity
MKARITTPPGAILIVPCLFFALLFMAGDGCLRGPHFNPGFATFKVTIEGNGRVEGIPADTFQRVGTRLTLTVAPDSGYFFVGWQGPSFSNANPLTITIEQNLLLVAYFAKPPVGLVPIHANGNSFAMGSSDSMALPYPYEQPVHTVHFAHDFYMSPCPVTQEEYVTLMGANPSNAVGTASVGDSFPVVHVTWYQAVLYCNRRSKVENYDTVYSYAAICTSAVCPVVLENLTINYNRFGYRLPTEAEWEYACRAGTTTDYYWGSGAQAESAAVKYAWYTSNAGGYLQKVGKLKPNGNGLYDMSGNVSQWVDDWLDYYSDTAVTDPIGPSQLSQAEYEASGEYRPLRGGSYALPAAYLRSSCRKGPYWTNPDDVGEDIGFRVALGAFRPGASLPKIVPADTFPITLSCDETNLIEFIGASRIKIAFVIGAVGHSRLVYLDLSQPDLHFQQCGRDSSVFGTSITPDGNFIAYSSNGEGSSSPCTTTVRRLDSLGSSPVRIAGAYLPHFWASPSSVDTIVIYSSGAADNSQSEWYTEKTYSRQFQGGSFGAVPTLMTPLGSYHGGLSSDGRFLGTGYKIGRAVDLQMQQYNTLYDTNIFYFCYPYNGYSDSARPQLCNLQMSPSIAEPGEALFLDFGDPTVNTLVGKSYGLHQILWVCNLLLLTPQQVEKWFEKPSGFETWEYPRWSNNSLFTIAITYPASGSTEAVYLIRNTDSAYLQVATGQNLSCPALWIDPTQVSEVQDSFPWFGAYDLPACNAGGNIFAQKLRLFWHFRQAPSVIAIGSSPIYYGFTPSAMAERTLNVASVASTPITDAVLSQEYLLPFAGPGLKVLLFDLFPGFLNVNGLTTFPQLDGVEQSLGWQSDSQHNFYRSGLPSQVMAKASAFTPSVSWTGLDSSGFLLSPPVGGGWGVPLFDFAGDYNVTDPAVQTSLGYIAALGDSAAAHNIHLILVYMPENPGYDSVTYNDTLFIGRYGPSVATYNNLVAWIDSLTQQNSHVHFWDANNYGHHDFLDSEALDCSHLNYKGGMRIAAKLDSLIRLWVH